MFKRRNNKKPPGPKSIKSTKRDLEIDLSTTQKKGKEPVNILLLQQPKAILAEINDPETNETINEFKRYYKMPVNHVFGLLYHESQAILKKKKKIDKMI